MTARLVGVMSLVLLLSLAAFALLAARYQDQVMTEVRRTVSATGRAALLSLPGIALPPCPPGAPEAAGGFRYEYRDVDGTVSLRWTGSPSASGAGGPDADLAGDGTGGRSATGRRVEREVTVRAFGTPLPGPPRPEPGSPGGSAAFRGNGAMLFVTVEGIRAEMDPSKDVLLRIPMHAPAGDVGAAPAGGLPVASNSEEIVVRIPTSEYRDLFAAFRGRSLLLFFGVFLLGTVLSAGLALRFTRPIRRLDAGIRRLSEGDLDVQVPVRGGDEVARLGAAFNEMARRLRASRERSAELTRREKLSALGRLAAGVAHDVRNPLHSIGLTLQHLKETCRPALDEAVDDAGGRASAEARAAEFDRSLGIIREEIRRLDRLVGNFLLFARSERRLERRRVDLAQLVEETASLVGKEAERRGIDVHVHTEGAPSVLGDVEALRSSVLELVLNAFEAMPQGGRLDLSLGREATEALLRVADTGVGIREEDRDRVFDFAWSTREEGHGLGLAMVHECVVEGHGGRVSLAGRPGEGTVVTLVLPIEPDGSQGEPA